MAIQRTVGTSTVLAALLALACAKGSTDWIAMARQLPADSAFAQVGPRALILGFPRVQAPSGWPSDSVAYGISAYEWRFGFEGPDSVVASYGVRVRRDRDAPPYGSLEAVLDRAALQMCDPSPGHVIHCAAGPLRSTATDDRGRVVLRVADTAVVNPFRHGRPEVLWMAVFVPGGSTVRESVAVTYP